MELISNTYQLDDTIVALSTPWGKGAIAVIRMSGKESFSILKQFVRSNSFLDDPIDRHAYLRHFYLKSELLDEVVVLCFKGPNSYTGENIVEISCHASPFIIEEILKNLVQAGARWAEKGEFSFRAFLNRKMDLSQAEAVADLISSKNRSEHRLALDQMKGGYSDRINELRKKLIDFLSLLELELDFGEEDVEFANREELINIIKDVRSKNEILIKSFDQGNVLKNGVPVVLFGRPNAGKSSLLNVLLREDRAIVSEIAGTTRDTIEESIIIEGVEYRLIDTAGIREAKDVIEEVGVKRTIEKINSSVILIYVFDTSRTTREEFNDDILQFIPDDQKNVLIVANKMDINTRAVKEDFVDSNAFPDKELIWIPISAKNEMNIELLKERISQNFQKEDDSEYDITVTNVRHLQALQNADLELEKAEDGLNNGLSSDLVALHLRYAADSLGAICGQITNDELLGNIFSNFCIGK